MERAPFNATEYLVHKLAQLEDALVRAQVENQRLRKELERFEELVKDVEPDDQD